MDIFNKKSLCAALAGVGALGLGGAAQAVNLNADGLGQVLIYPYYTVRNDAAGNAFNSLLSVVNTTTSAKAVKVRFLEGKNSREVLDFNLFLSHNDVWTAALGPASGGGTVLQTTDKSCTLPAIPSGGVTFRNTLLSADGAGATLDRTTEGYVEIIEMATFADDSATAVAITHVNGVPKACGDVSDTQAAADAAAGGGVQGGLMGGMTLVNVNSGSDYTEDAVALDNFATGIPLYFNAGDTRPTLQNVQPATSVVIADGGLVFTSDWSLTPGSNAADPVSAVLMHDTVMNEYVLDPDTHSGTDWVVTMPTKRFYVSNGTGTPSSLFQHNFNKTVGSCDDVSLGIFDREENGAVGEVDFSPLPEAGTNSLCWEANVVTFNNSNVLGSANSVNISTSQLPAGATPNGWAQISFFPETVTGSVHTLGNDTTTFVVPQVTPPFVSPTSAATYFGLPVVGFAVESYTNGAINVNGTATLSNYGGNFVHKGTRVVGIPAPAPTAD
jgi:hypothetical protein